VDWDSDLRALTGGLGWLFTRPEPRETFADLVRGLLADVRRKNSWQIAEHVGHRSRHRLELLLNGAVWDADVLRDEVRSYVVEHLGDADAALVLDDTQVVKKGVKSVGVAPQHCGMSGDVANCQVLVMGTYASVHGHAFIDRDLYLPGRWCADLARCEEAGVPADRVRLLTKPQLAVRIVERALLARVPFRWVAADSGYGRDPGLRRFCRDQRLPFVMAVPVDLPLTTAPAAKAQVKAAGDLIGRVRLDSWQQRSAGAGTKGQRWYDWALVAVSVKGEPAAPGFVHHLLMRRNTADHTDIELFLVHAPTDTPLSDMVTAAGLRWKIEENNEHGKDLLGLDQYQVRKWTPLFRHVTACMLAQAFLTVTRVKLGKEQPSTSDLPPQPGSGTRSTRSVTSSPAPS
jgi:SRSO17 transposase